MKPCLIAFDIDETLYDHKNNEIPASTIEALHELKKNGHVLAIATGRSPFDVTDEIRALPFDYFIVQNGQYIFSREMVLHSQPLSPDLLRRITLKASRLGIYVGYLSATCSALNMANEKIVKAFKAYGLTPPETRPTIIDEEPVYQMWIFSEDYEDFSKEFENDVRFVPWRNNGADILCVNASKAKGLDTLRKYVPNLPEKVIFFGDGMNDYELIMQADIGVAMGNGEDRLKEVADFVTQDIDKGGIFYACEHLGLFDAPVDKFLNDLRRELTENPTDLNLVFKLKQLYSSTLNNVEAGLRVLLDAYKLQPKNVILLSEIASYFEFELDDFNQAKLFYQKILEIDPANRIALDALDIIEDQTAFYS